MQIKKCTKCEIYKDLSEFNKNKRYKDGIISICKKCKSKMNMSWAKNNPNKVKAIRDSHTLKHRDELNLKSRQWYLNNPDKVKQGRNNNKTKRNQQRKERRKTDVKYRLIELCRHRQYLTLNGNIKSAHTIELIGCSIEFFKNYLFTKFHNDYPKVALYLPACEMHHIVKCSDFNMSDPEQQRKCFHYTNVKLMLKADHRDLHKRDKNA
jgi:hypothetical protein